MTKLQWQVVGYDKDGEALVEPYGGNPTKVDGAIRLNDIPDNPLKFDEISAIVDKEFDYADKANVSLRESKRHIREELQNDILRSGLMEVNRAFDTQFALPEARGFGELEEVPDLDEFGFGSKTLEVGKAAHRGLGGVVKVPGVALKAVGEQAYTRQDIESMPDSGIRGLHKAYLKSPIGKTARTGADMIRRAGNAYIEQVNSMTLNPSREAEAQIDQPFMEAPFFRTGMAVGESAPAYGLAVVGSLTTGNPYVGLSIVGASASSNAYEKYRDMGVDPDLALVASLTEGSIEVLTEKIPMDELLKGGGRPILMRALRAGTFESFQELFAHLGQNYVTEVTKDVDPENLGSVVAAARQEWRVIAKGWEDAVAAGFVMGSGAGGLQGGVSGNNPFMTREQMQHQYAVKPAQTRTFDMVVNQIRQDVKKIEKVAQEAEEPTAEEPEPEPTPQAETQQDLTYKELQAKAKELGIKANQKKADLQQQVAEQEKAQPTLETGLKNLTPEENAELADLERQLSDKIRNQLSIGLDPDTFILATRVGSFYIKAGFRSFKAWSAQVRTRLGDISDYTLRTIYANLRGEFDGLDDDTTIDHALVTGIGEEIGTGEEQVRGSARSALSFAIEKELIRETQDEIADQFGDEIPTYLTTQMGKQADLSANLIEQDLQKAIRVATYQETAPSGIFPESVYTALKIYASQTGDVNLIFQIGLNEGATRQHTIMGARIKALDTGLGSLDPFTAIQDIVEARKEQMVRRGKDVSALEEQLRKLQAKFDDSQRKLDTYIKQAETKARRTYGSKNKLVSRDEYESIIARRKTRGLSDFLKDEGGYAPNAEDLADMIRVGMFHLEAMGRDIAKWSYQMKRDFGAWIEPHLQETYDKAIEEAKTQGIPIKDSKRLVAKKKRLHTGTQKAEAALSELDLEKTPQIPIELDEQGRKLEADYRIARTALKAAQETANIITEEEVRTITELAKQVQDKRLIMENSVRRDTLKGEGATPKEMEYGLSVALFLDYIKVIKDEAGRKTIGEATTAYLENPVQFLTDFAGTLKAAKASLDNSFHFRQGLPTFLKGLTHPPTMKIWWNTFIKSWKLMGKTIKHEDVMHGLFAEMVSDPDYDLLKRSKIAISTIEEEIPVDIPSRIPLVGILFRMGENAFVGSSRYMRYQLAKQYLNIWRKSGTELSKKELESIGRLANSQTGRGHIASTKAEPGLLNNAFWSPRNLRAYIDILTLHAFDPGMGSVLPWKYSMARKQAAYNLLRYISGAAMILAMAKWIDDDSVTFDSKSADFGKIKIGNSRFSVGGGITPLVVLASRLIQRETTSTTTGRTYSIDSGKFGAITGKDLVFNFLENKTSPAAQMILSIVEQKTWEGNELTVPQMAEDAFLPLILQNLMETSQTDDAANVLAVLIAESLGVNVQSYEPRKKTSGRSRVR